MGEVHTTSLKKKSRIPYVNKTDKKYQIYSLFLKLRKANKFLQMEANTPLSSGSSSVIQHNILLQQREQDLALFSKELSSK